ncbi:Protein phosphatase, putative [Hondaea fermentalgiana]|uniref:Protein phosphatase, putative n=1 Tax=Hondaea fermentalgiana TaxID=2315210 RepID=A0A2R5GAV9_9STRA|nr:Protein phosphatase, putative [Hondaea fermentalgiana]|eukprot:GBG28152.1 Protein phosphatase, putative [Hondaea fermentalgiana]
MGCCSSAPELGASSAPDLVESMNSGESVDSEGSRKELMHTNSMLFPRDAIEEAKRSLRLKKPIGREDATPPVIEQDDPDGVLMTSDPLYELGMEIEYPVEMSETMTIQLLKKKKKKKNSASSATKADIEGAIEDFEDTNSASADDDDDEEAAALDEVQVDMLTSSPKAQPASSLGDFEKGHKLHFGYKSIQGRSASPPSKPNQDSVVAFVVDGKPNQAVFGIFDGHGPYGEHASHFCRMELHKTIIAVYEEFGDDLTPKDVLEHSIARMHESFISTDPGYSGVDPNVSGTTLVVAMIVDSKMYVANVGDSRCILGEKASGNFLGSVVEMSDDHKPERESERVRIDATDAVLMSEGELRGGLRSEGKTYICRRRNGDIIYGVLFTRSVGDADAHNFLGVSAEPEFQKRRINKKLTQYLVLASDGVWDQMGNEQVLSKVYAVRDPLSAAERIADIARDLWDTDRTHSRRDDITVCVVQLD